MDTYHYNFVLDPDSSIQKFTITKKANWGLLVKKVKWDYVYRDIGLSNTRQTPLELVELSIRSNCDLLLANVAGKLNSDDIYYLELEKPIVFKDQLDIVIFNPNTLNGHRLEIDVWLEGDFIRIVDTKKSTTFGWDEFLKKQRQRRRAAIEAFPEVEDDFKIDKDSLSALSIVLWVYGFLTSFNMWELFLAYLIV